MKIADNLHAFIWESMTANNCNTYLVDGPTRILIDPGHIRLFDHVQQGLREIGLGLDDIGLVICTHAHPDHIEAVQLFNETPALFTIHEKEWQMVREMQKRLGMSLGAGFEKVEPDFFLQEGELTVPDTHWQVFHTPGHSPGAVCLYWEEQKALFTGDLIFKDGVGRTDLPGGNASQLKESIGRLDNLDVEWLLSGHGEVVAGAKAVARNFEGVVNYWFNYI